MGTTDTIVKQATGMMVDSWEIALAAGENATLGIHWVGKDMAFSTADALDGSVPTGLSAYTYIDGTVTVGGASVGCVKNITIAGANNLASDDQCLGSSVISDQERDQFCEITGNIDFELEKTDTGYLTISLPAPKRRSCSPWRTRRRRSRSRSRCSGRPGSPRRCRAPRS